ncbi:MAG: hypothetical protein WCW27_06590 [Patescibacteria group bacterium]|jgi:hypothetical protein
MSHQKIILGLEEEIKIFLPNKKFIRRKAKIDTGARTTAIDISIAKKIGLYHVYEQFHALLPKLTVTHNNFKKIRKLINQEIKPQLKKQIPNLYDVQITPATNGVSIRPYVKFSYRLRNKRLNTIASIVDRKILLYPVLVGKRDMTGFLIDPTKNVYRTA